MRQHEENKISEKFHYKIRRVIRPAILLFESILFSCQLSLFFVFGLSFLSASAQENALYFELGGSGGLGSFNFERSIKEYKKNYLTWSAGISLAPIDPNNGTGLVFPVQIHALRGNSAHKIEGAIGQGFTITTKGHFFTLTTLCLGYRNQKEGRRWFYRITYTPLISYLLDFQIQHWAGISIGYSLNSSR